MSSFLSPFVVSLLLSWLALVALAALLMFLDSARAHLLLHRIQEYRDARARQARLRHHR